jgi:glycosyltransferase involved in cell wall biosynthesis
MDKSLQDFNTKDTVLVITSYPDRTDSKYGRKEFNAVGWHSTKTLSRLATHGKVLICAERHPKQKQGVLKKKNLLITRIWEKGNLFSFFSLLQFILRQTEIKSLFVQFEFNVYGGILPNLMLLAVLAIARLTGRKVTFEMHQVITDIALLAKHINITNPLAQAFFNAGLRVFYRVTGTVANTVIVFEEELKERLIRLGVTDQKIEVFSLSIDKKVKLNKSIARRKLGIPENEFVLMVFGFINGYKGIDWIIDNLKQTKKLGKKPFRLLIAGGANPYLKDKPSYQAFYNSIVAAAGKHAHITHTGFIPDSDVSYYFSAADLVVLPYEVFMSASGPFSLSLSYGTPVILSEALTDYSKSSDFAHAMREAAITKNDIFFPLRKSALIKKLNSSANNPTYLSNLTTFSETLATYRDSRAVVLRLHKLLQVPSLPLVPTVLPRLRMEV